MANRNNTHESIATLSTHISQLNADLKTRNDVSVLDIDLLRKHTIDLYEEVNRLRLVMKEDVVAIETENTPAIPVAESPEKEEEKEEEVEKVVEPAPIEVPEKEEPEVPLTPEPDKIEHDSPNEVPERHEPERIAPNPPTEVPEPNSPDPVLPNPKALEINGKVHPEETETLVHSEENVLAAEAKVEADAIKSASNEEEANDLAHKFSNTPINDLKKAISIVKKFEFINALFAGNVEKYAYSIHHMNNLVSGDEAFTYLHDLRSEYKWDDEDKNFLELANLVRRRYLG